MCALVRYSKLLRRLEYDSVMADRFMKESRFNQRSRISKIYLFERIHYIDLTMCNCGSRLSSFC